MLFNSFEFLFAFLPATLLVYSIARARLGARVAMVVLSLASLLFYVHWNPRHLPLILTSILFNYCCGLALVRWRDGAPRLAHTVFVCGVTLNLLALGYFKYAAFAASTLAQLAGSPLQVEPLELPLAISFFTFQQIDYLVDALAGGVGRQRLSSYCLFVTFFPHLIAGPIVRHAEMMPQFERPQPFRHADLALGLSVFVVGLAKKVLIADALAAYASPMFAAAAGGEPVAFVAAWAGGIAYALQLYFDFSGYSDMALGLGRMFGIRLPLNFDSPYKATSVIEFWRRWHMTLTRLLTAYVYSPMALAAARARMRLGLASGGFAAFARESLIPTLTTMLLVGVWHGAGFQFVAFGLLHGLFLCVNHAWRGFKSSRRPTPQRVPARLRQVSARVCTFAAVSFAFVFFRAESLEAALRIAAGMLGANGVLLPPRYLALLGPLGSLAEQLGVAPGRDSFQGGWQLLWIAAALAVAWLAPNTQQIFARHLDERAAALPAGEPAFAYRTEPSRSRAARWRPNLAWALLVAAAGACCVLRMHYSSEFLYFGF